FEAPSGLPLVQHSLAMLLEQHRAGLFSLETIVEKSAHNPARRFRIVDRGFIREGYFADLAIIDLAASASVTEDRILYKCGWSPLLGTTFHSELFMTVLNGRPVYREGSLASGSEARPLEFSQA